MEIEDIRRIGRRVYEGVKAVRAKDQLPLERGAGGDRTFPVDRLAEDIILSGLRGLGLKLHVVSEEAGILDMEGTGEPMTLAIDPVDGSKNAVAGISFFAASIAAGHGGRLGDIESGYVINLVTGDEYWAVRGGGAFLNGLPIRCQSGPELKLALFEASSPARHLRRILPLLEGAAKTRCMGSIALDLALLASGAASFFVSPAQSRSFDYAAGYLLVKEAGGIFTGTDGNDLDGLEIGLEKGSPLLASANHRIHTAALKALAQIPDKKTPDSKMPGKQQDLAHAFLDAASRLGPKTFFHYETGGAAKTLSHEEFIKRASGVSDLLSSLGISPGGRVAILAASSLEDSGLFWCIAFAGTVLSGAVAVPLNESAPEAELKFIFDDCRPEVLFVDGKTRNLAALAPQNVKILDLDSPGLKQILSTGDGVFPDREGKSAAEPAKEDVAVILYTSGTTGPPKGVMLTHGNLLADVEGIAAAEIVSEEDNLLSALPYYHAYPLMGCLIAPFLIGASVTLLPSMKELARAVRENRVTVILAVPQMLELLLGAIKKKMPRALMPLLAACGLIREKTGFNPGRAVFSKAHAAFGPGLRLLASGGARLAPKTMRELEGLGFTVVEGFGLTETSPVVTFNPVEKRKPGSAGRPIAGAEIKIEDDEVLIRGPMLMKGYWQRPEETAQSIRDGWFHTGDTGFLDREGYLHVTGRKKEILVLSSGKNIYPEEVEGRYRESLLIKEIAVYESSGVLKGVIVPDFDYARLHAVSNLKEEIGWELMRIGQHMPSYMRVKGFTLSREPLPRTPLGKLKRYKLEQLAAGVPPEIKGKKTGAEFLSGPGAKVARALASAAGGDEKLKISAGDSLELDIGLDSLKKIELLAALEEEFLIAGEGHLPEDFLADVQTAGELLQKISAFTAFTRERAPVKISFTLPERAAGIFVLMVLKLLTKLLFRGRAKGVNNIPPSPFILAPNHSSLLDGFLVAALLPRRAAGSLFFLGWETYFRWPVSLVVRIIHVIPINLGTLLGSALKRGAEALGQGYSLCVFPEGGRSFDGRLMELKPGIAAMAKGANAPIVPAWIEGAARALPRGALLVRPVKIEVRFGRPLYPGNFDSDEALLDALAEAIKGLGAGV